jgi:hypothetical protein
VPEVVRLLSRDGQLLTPLKRDDLSVSFVRCDDYVGLPFASLPQTGPRS